jgi:hypothetical protein
VLVLSTFDDYDYVYGAPRAGASGVSGQDIDLDVVWNTIMNDLPALEEAIVRWLS